MLSLSLIRTQQVGVRPFLRNSPTLILKCLLVFLLCFKPTLPSHFSPPVLLVPVFLSSATTNGTLVLPWASPRSFCSCNHNFSSRALKVFFESSVFCKPNDFSVPFSTFPTVSPSYGLLARGLIKETFTAYLIPTIPILERMTTLNFVCPLPIFIIFPGPPRRAGGLEFFHTPPPLTPYLSPQKFFFQPFHSLVALRSTGSLAKCPAFPLGSV